MYMGLRNLPTDKAVPLARLVTHLPGHVSSIALSCVAAVADATGATDVADVADITEANLTCASADITLLSFAAGESVSEEEYFGDTLYYVVEGNAVVVLPDVRVSIAAGEVLMVPAHVLHAIESADDQAFTLLQITVP